MFHQHVQGAMIVWKGQRLIFHSAPVGLVQYDDVATGEIHKWTPEHFKQLVDDKEILPMATTASAAQIVPIESGKRSFKSMLVGLTDHESRVQASLLHAFKTFEASKLSLRRDAERVQALIADACSAGGLQHVTLMALKKVVRRLRSCRDLFYACTPERRGAPYGSKTLSQRDEKLVEAAIDQHYLKLEQPSAASAYRHYRRLRQDAEAEQGKWEEPPASMRTFQRRVSRIDSFHRTERREGFDAARSKHRMVRGVYSNVDPMEIGEMDDCYLPIMVVSDDYSHALGMPRMTALRDRGTGYLASLFLWCGEVSTFTSLATLRNLLADKTGLLNHASLPATCWHYTGPFATIATDRGSNLNSQAFVRAATAMGSAVQFLPRRSPWLKPFIERFHGLVLEYVVKEMQGRIFDDVEFFRSYKAKVKAVVPLSALIRILVRFCMEVINGIPRPGHRATPAEEMGAWLADYPPPIPCDPKEIDLITAMPVERVVNQEGIRWENLHFVSEELRDMMRRIGHRASVTVYVNPANLGEVSVLDPCSNALVKAYCTWAGYAHGLSLPEHQLLVRGLNARREVIKLETLIRFQRAIATELDAARMGKKASTVALKAERMQKSSANFDGARPALAIEATPGAQGVLEALLF